MKRILIELAWYLPVLFGMSCMMHPDLLSDPIDRLKMMQSLGNFFHPLIWSLSGYFGVSCIRLIFKRTFL